MTRPRSSPCRSRSPSCRAAAAQQPPADPQNTVYLDTKDGRITIRLRPDLAPKHVEQIKALTKRGLLQRHRLPPRHRRLHGPDRRPDRHRHGRLGPAEPAGRVHRRSRSSAAASAWRARRTRTPPIPSSSSATSGCGSLTGQYTIVGEVVSGMEVADKIKKGERPRQRQGRRARTRSSRCSSPRMRNDKAHPSPPSSRDNP